MCYVQYLGLGYISKQDPWPHGAYIQVGGRKRK